ncbi:MAG: hypothetical protein WDM81_10235 [Rhizomicrobium sp.]
MGVRCSYADPLHGDCLHQWRRRRFLGRKVVSEEDARGRDAGYRELRFHVAAVEIAARSGYAAGLAALVADAHRRAGDKPMTIAACKAYLAKQPDDADAAAILKALEGG